MMSKIEKDNLFNQNINNLLNVVNLFTLMDTEEWYVTKDIFTSKKGGAITFVRVPPN
jgi:hypothetical protein